MPDHFHERPCSGPEPLSETLQESLVRIEERIDPKSRDFYRRAIGMLQDAGVPLLVGGAFAFEYYTGISRYTKDFDVFIRAQDAERALAVFSSTGFKTEITAPHWLAKVCENGVFVDIIFGGANKVSAVDDAWFEHSVPEAILGMDLRLCPVEEMIWSKSFVMDRDRYDGADVAHLLNAHAESLDWDRLLARFGEHWHVLLSHLLLFTFIYPSEFRRIPGRVLQELLRRFQRSVKKQPSPERICRGTLLSMQEYHIDVTRNGYRDARESKDAA